MNMTMNLHRVVSITLEPKFDDVTGELSWVDLMATTDDGAEQEITFFCAMDTPIKIEAQGDAIEWLYPASKDDAA